MVKIWIGNFLTFLILPLELLHEVIDETVVEIFTTQMCVTGGSFDFEDTFLDGQKGNIKCSSTKVENKDEALALGLIVKTVSDSSGCGLVDDTENLEASNLTSILCCETL